MSEDSDSMDSGSSNRSGLINSNRTERDDGYWETPIVRDRDGEAIGASFFLTEADLLLRPNLGWSVPMPVIPQLR